MQKPTKYRRGGYTWVEMGVVLLVIAVAIGAALIGRDMRRNAEYMRIKQEFVDQWVIAYNSYHASSGAPVGDNPAAPRLMVAGADSAHGNVLFSESDLSGQASPGAICNVSAPRHASPPITVAVSKGGRLRDILRGAGIRLPPGRGEGFEDRYVYLDSNGTSQEIQVCFQWNPAGTASGAGNVMILSGLSPELARSLDQMIDGKPDPQSGAFRQAGMVAKKATDSDIDWNGNNTRATGSSQGRTPIEAGESTDSGKMPTLTAYYKMNP